MHGAGTRYPSAVVVAKWVAHLLEYEAVPNKHLLLEVGCSAVPSPYCPTSPLPTMTMPPTY